MLLGQGLVQDFGSILFCPQTTTHWRNAKLFGGYMKNELRVTDRGKGPGGGGGSGSALSPANAALCGEGEKRELHHGIVARARKNAWLMHFRSDFANINRSFSALRLTHDYQERKKKKETKT